MHIQVIGSGCQTCKKLHEQTVRIAAELGLSGEVEYATDISQIVALGLMQSPVLVIDGEAVMVGAGDPAVVREKLQAALSKAQ